jgi:signal transduction histidine kinase/CheY-like chemotaxis protein
VLDHVEEALVKTFGSLEAVPPAWRDLLQGLSDRVAQAEGERERSVHALERARTELRELLVELEALRRARASAESTNLVRGEVLATVSRTMRTPTDAILGLTALLRTGALLPTQRAYVDAVHGAAEALRGILNDVSDFSSLEGGTLPLEPIGFDLRVMVKDLAAALGAQAEAKGVGLRFAWHPDAPRRVVGDPGRIRQVLSALVTEGLGRVQRGEVVVEVGRALAGPGVRFVVEDTGPAVPDDLLPTIFEPFSRGDIWPARDAGLGLPIARQLAYLMGGGIEASNIKGAGTRFTAYFPLPIERDESGLPTGPSRDPEASLSLPPRTPLLVVDADDHQRASWSAIAGAAGYDPVGCGRRDDAVEELRRLTTRDGKPPAVVVFSDHDAEGYDRLGRAILEDPALGKPALIMLPAVGNHGDARRLSDAGFRGYLVKPIVPSDLREILETLRRTPRARWHLLFLTRHALAEARREGGAGDADVDATFAQLITTSAGGFAGLSRDQG